MPDAYDEIAYPDLSHATAHPDRMAVVARLFGMDPPRVDSCYVLELGCAAGANLLPMASGFPESRFLGIDRSEQQIARGLGWRETLGLSNLSLEAMDLTDLDEDEGPFDYIIVHGVYSWVPPDVQRRILEICGTRLSPNGVAYVSYDTLPGGHLMRIVNDALLYGARAADSPAERTQAARRVLDVLRICLPRVAEPAWKMLAERIPYLVAPIPEDAAAAEAFLLHGPLSEETHPIYLHQFIDAAADHGLQYLGDANVSSMVPSNYAPEVAQSLVAASGDRLELEQYLDFVRLRSFRTTLLCRREVPLEHHLSGEAVRSFLVASAARAHDDGTVLAEGTPATYMGRSGESFVTDLTLAKLAIAHLSRSWPRRVPFPELMQRTLDLRKALDGYEPADPGEDEERLRLHLLRAYACGGSIIEFNTVRPHHVEHVSDRPAAVPAIRMQAQRAAGITNLWHEWIPLDDFSRHLLPALDGTRDQRALCERLKGQVEAGALALEEDGSPVQDNQRIQQILAHLLSDYLPQYAAAAILQA